MKKTDQEYESELKYAREESQKAIEHFLGHIFDPTGYVHDSDTEKILAFLNRDIQTGADGKGNIIWKPKAINFRTLRSFFDQNHKPNPSTIRLFKNTLIKKYHETLQENQIPFESSQEDIFSFMKKVTSNLNSVELLINSKNYKEALFLLEKAESEYIQSEPALALIKAYRAIISYRQTFDLQLFNNSMLEALAVFKNNQLTDETLKYSGNLWSVNLEKGKMQLAQSIAEDILLYGRSLGDHYAEGIGHWFIGQANLGQNNHQSAIASFKTVLEHCMTLYKSGNEVQIARSKDLSISTYSALGHINYSVLNNIREAKSYFVKILELLEQGIKYDNIEIGSVYFKLANIEYLQGNSRNKKFWQYLLKAKEISDSEQNYPMILAIQNFYLGIKDNITDKKVLADMGKVIFSEASNFEKPHMSISEFYKIAQEKILDDSAHDIKLVETTIDQAFETFTQRKQYDTLGLFCHLKGLIEEKRGNSAKAKEYFNQAIEYLDIFHSLTDIEHNKVELLKLIGNIYKKTNNFQRAIDTLEEARSYLKKVKDVSRLCEIEIHLGLCYSHVDNFDKTISIWEGMIKSVDNHLPHSLTFKVYILLGAIYFHVKKDPITGSSYFLKGIKLKEAYELADKKSFESLTLAITEMFGRDGVKEFWDHFFGFMKKVEEVMDKQDIDKK